MTKFILAIFIFCVVLFLYLHIYYHLKTSDEMEIFELDESDLSKSKLQELCDLRQPVSFPWYDPDVSHRFHLPSLLTSFASYEIKVRSHTDHWNPEEDLYIPVPLSDAMKLFQQDRSSSHFSENNIDFLEETSLLQELKQSDALLRPQLMSNAYYDILFGSEGVTTPLRYDICYRHYLVLLHGKVVVKLTPPKSERFLHPEYDYEHFEFRSPIHPWNPQAKYKKDFDRVKCITFTLLPGRALFVPAYWWYSMQWQSSDTVLARYSYRTYMNTVAISPYIGLHLLQMQNIRHKIAKRAHYVVEDDQDDAGARNNATEDSIILIEQQEVNGKEEKEEEIKST